MFGLNIHLKSFKLNKNIISGSEKVRVSITTYPEQNKEAFVTEAKQMFCIHHFFTVNVSEKTEKIVFVFRKKGFFEDTIIASTIIHSEDVALTKRNKTTEMKTFNIYEPVQNGHKIRQVYGEMQVQFSLTSAFPTFEKKQISNNNNKNNNKSTKTSQATTKFNGYSYAKINNIN